MGIGGERNHARLLEYECGLERLFRRTSALCGICQYHQETLPAEVIHAGVRGHQGVFVNETLSRINPYYLPPESLSAGVPALSDEQVQSMLRHLCGSILGTGSVS